MIIFVPFEKWNTIIVSEKYFSLQSVMIISCKNENKLINQIISLNGGFGYV